MERREQMGPLKDRIFFPMGIVVWSVVYTAPVNCYSMLEAFDVSMQVNRQHQLRRIIIAMSPKGLIGNGVWSGVRSSLRGPSPICNLLHGSEAQLPRRRLFVAYCIRTGGRGVVTSASSSGFSCKTKPLRGFMHPIRNFPDACPCALHT